jgi:hypothetical protein
VKAYLEITAFYQLLAQSKQFWSYADTLGVFCTLNEPNYFDPFGATKFNHNWPISA